jgi:hypothetical protein
MAADFKSHILSRDEKGFGGIPFKRLLLGGIGGGFAYTLSRFALPSAAIVIGSAIAILLVVLTSPRGGLPLWMRLRGTLLLTAIQNPTGLFGEVAQMLNLPLESASLNGEKLFAPPTGLVEIDFSEWVTFVRARDLDSDDGLVFVSSALDEGVA